MLTLIIAMQEVELDGTRQFNNLTGVLPQAKRYQVFIYNFTSGDFTQFALAVLLDLIHTNSSHNGSSQSQNCIHLYQ